MKKKNKKKKSFLKFLKGESSFLIMCGVFVVLMSLIFASHSYSEAHPEVCNSNGCTGNPYALALFAFLIFVVGLITYYAYVLDSE